MQEQPTKLELKDDLGCTLNATCLDYPLQK